MLSRKGKKTYDARYRCGKCPACKLGKREGKRTARGAPAVCRLSPRAMHHFFKDSK